MEGMKTLIALLSLLTATVVADPISDCANPQFSRSFHDKQQGATRRVETVLENRQRGNLGDCTAVIMGQADAYYMLEQTDTAGKFPMLGRFPDQHTQGKKGGEQLVIPYAEGTLAVMPNPMLDRKSVV